MASDILQIVLSNLSGDFVNFYFGNPKIEIERFYLSRYFLMEVYEEGLVFCGKVLDQKCLKKRVTSLKRFEKPVFCIRRMQKVGQKVACDKFWIW